MDGLFGRATEKVQAELRRLREMQEPGMRCTPMVGDEQRHFTVHFFQDQQQMVPLGDAELRLARDMGAVQGYPWVPPQLKLAGDQRLVEPWCDTASGEIDVRKLLGSWTVFGGSYETELLDTLRRLREALLQAAPAPAAPAAAAARVNRRISPKRYNNAIIPLDNNAHLGVARLSRR